MLSGHYDRADKRRELFVRWFPEYEASQAVTHQAPATEPEEDRAGVSATIAASLGLGAGE